MASASPPSNFNCLPNCGVCCNLVSFHPMGFDSLFDRIQRDPIKFLYTKDGVWPITEDLTCCFLSKEKLCAIYESRPPICVLFGTIPKHGCPFLFPDGKPRSEKQRDKLLQEQEEHVKRLRENIKEYQERYRL